jgi:pimeloyl-ACP methyl ester carboxylesterase
VLVPLVLFQHFRGNLDNWDPALIDALASTRRVITFDNAGVAGSAGTTPNTVEQMGHDAIAFITAMDLGQVDLLGFSIGSFVAQQIGLTRPAIVRKLVLASAAPQGAPGMHGWALRSSAASAPQKPARRNTSASSSPNPHQAGSSAYLPRRCRNAGGRLPRHRRPVPVLPGPERAVLRRQPARLGRLPGCARLVLAVGMQAGGKAAYDCIKAFSETDLTEDLKRFDVPTLIVHGDDDQIVPIADSALQSAKIVKDTTLKVYPGPRTA